MQNEPDIFSLEEMQNPFEAIKKVDSDGLSVRPSAQIFIN